MRRIKLIRFALVYSTLSLILLLEMAGCAQPIFLPPQALNLKAPPQEVTVTQVCRDYQADPTAADAKYMGKRLLFRNAEIEDVFKRMYTDRHGQINFVNEYLRAGIIRFELRDFSVALQNVKAGYVLNLVGLCEGFSVPRGMIMVTDCWVESVKGDLGLGGPGYVPY